MGGAYRSGSGAGRYQRSSSRQRVTFAGNRTRRIKRFRRGGVTKRRGGIRGRRYKRSNVTQAFKRNLVKAQGQVFKLTRNIQSEFQVPLASVDAIQEPKAQWMWPRVPSADQASHSYYTPQGYFDMVDLMPKVFGTGWYATLNNSEVFDSYFSIAWQARYMVMNLTNVPVRYVAKVFKVKRDVPNLATSTSTRSFNNPLNIVGQYLKDIGDKAIADGADANNSGLHTERVQLESIPAWNHWFKTLRTDRFTLGPGKRKAHTLKRRNHNIKLVDLFPNVIAGTVSAPAILNAFRRGDTFIMYKMLSDPADVNDATSDPLSAESTRTTPLSLLSYQVNYIVRKPNVTIRSQFTPLDSHGFKSGVAAADIAVMADDDIKEVAQIVVT